MPIDQAIVKAHEWIGLKVRILSADDPSHKGVTGIVEDESRNMFTIRTDSRTVRVPKEKSSFLLEFADKQSVTVEGNSVKHRPEDRIKKVLGKW